MPWEKRTVDGNKVCVYKKGANTPLHCYSGENADELANKYLAALYANAEKMTVTNTKRVEIFAAGKWNGMTFTKKDLQTIVTAFDALGSNHKVPLKFGHNDKQKMTDGQPALGWVTGLTVEGDKLIADMSDIPDVVMSAMDKKLYRNVSVELDFDVKYKDQHFPIVLSGVALLGADIPAVNTLKDLTHYLGRDAAFSVGHQAMFSAIAGTKQGDEDMELKELVDQVAKLTTDMQKLTAENAAFKADNEKLKAETAKFAAEKTATEETAKKATLAAKRAEITAIFEAGVSAKTITPAMRESFSKLLNIDSDGAVEATNVEEVKKLVANGSKIDFSKQQGRQDNEDDRQETRAPDVLVAEGIQIILSKKEALDWNSAQVLLFSRDPKLARAYLNHNDGGE